MGGADPEWGGEDAGGPRAARNHARPNPGLDDNPVLFQIRRIPASLAAGPAGRQPAEKHRSAPAPYPSAKEALLQLQGAGWAGELGAKTA